MALRLNSLQAEAAIVSAILAGFTLNAVALIMQQRSAAREQIEREATSFAELTKAPICTAYYDFYESGFYKFRELIKDRMQLNLNVERIQIVSVRGEVVFDSAEMHQPTSRAPTPGGAGRVSEPARLEAVKRLEPTVHKVRAVKGDPRFVITSPYIEDWGRHELSVVYEVSYDKTLRRATRRLILTTAVPALVCALVTIGVVLMLLRRVE